MLDIPYVLLHHSQWLVSLPDQLLFALQGVQVNLVKETRAGLRRIAWKLFVRMQHDTNVPTLTFA